MEDASLLGPLVGNPVGWMEGLLLGRADVGRGVCLSDCDENTLCVVSCRNRVFVKASVPRVSCSAFVRFAGDGAAADVDLLEIVVARPGLIVGSLFGGSAPENEADLCNGVGPAACLITVPCSDNVCCDVDGDADRDAAFVENGH